MFCPVIEDYLPTPSFLPPIFHYGLVIIKVRPFFPSNNVKDQPNSSLIPPFSLPPYNVEFERATFAPLGVLPVWPWQKSSTLLPPGVPRV